MENSTFRNMATDNSNDRITLLFNFVAENLSIDCSFEMNTLTLSNISMSMLSLSSIIGETSSNKTVIISNVVFTDALFPTRNNFITFEPFITTQNIIIKMKNLEFSNLNFLNTANIIEVSMQTLTPVFIDS
jgi:ABC-type dipeptide/oligopeptide/nickel transport system ATPase component